MPLAAGIQQIGTGVFYFGGIAAENASDLISHVQAQRFISLV